MKKKFTYVLLLLLVTYSATQVFRMYFSENISVQTEVTEAEECSAEVSEQEFSALTFGFNEHHYSSVQKSKFTFSRHFSVDENHSSEIDFPPESV